MIDQYRVRVVFLSSYCECKEWYSWLVVTPTIFEFCLKLESCQRTAELLLSTVYTVYTVYY